MSLLAIPLIVSSMVFEGVRSQAEEPSLKLISGDGGPATSAEIRLPSQEWHSPWIALG